VVIEVTGFASDRVRTILPRRLKPVQVDFRTIRAR